MTGTWTPGPDDEFDLAELAASDAWLDAVASRTAGSDPLAAQLVAWLDRIDEEHEPPGADGADAAASELAPVVDLRAASGAGRRMPRRAFAAVAILSAATLAGAGVAAASPGTPLYPVHRVVFGAADQQALDRASRLLDQAAAIITPAQAAGVISADDRAAAARWLGLSAGLLDHASASSRRAALERRQAGLETALAALPTAPVAVPAASPHPSPADTSHGGSGTDSGRHGTSDGSGKQSGTEDKSGSDKSGSDQSGSDDKSGSDKSGSDEKSGSDTSGSGDQSGSGETSGSGGTSGDTSGDSSGQRSGDGSTDGSGSGDSGQQSGSDDGSGSGSGDGSGDSGGGGSDGSGSGG
jgi:hypothetical protein